LPNSVGRLAVAGSSDSHRSISIEHVNFVGYNWSFSPPHIPLTFSPPDQISICEKFWDFYKAGPGGVRLGTSIDSRSRCGGTVKVIVDAPNRYIEDQGVMDQILDHLRRKKQSTT
jgi:hypothetical protein